MPIELKEVQESFLSYFAASNPSPEQKTEFKNKILQYISENPGLTASQLTADHVPEVLPQVPTEPQSVVDDSQNVFPMADVMDSFEKVLAASGRCFVDGHISSRISESELHAPIFRMKVPTYVMPTGPDSAQLFIDVKMQREQYQRLLDVLVEIGLVEASSATQLRNDGEVTIPQAHLASYPEVNPLFVPYPAVSAIAEKVRRTAQDIVNLRTGLEERQQKIEQLEEMCSTLRQRLKAEQDKAPQPLVQQLKSNVVLDW